MSVFNNEILVISLSSGTQVLTRVVEETEVALKIEIPFEINISFNEKGVALMYLSRYMPYGLLDQAFIMKHNIESFTVCKESYRDHYTARVELYKSMMDEIDIEEGLDSLPSEEQADFEDKSYDDVPENVIPFNSKPTKTIH